MAKNRFRKVSQKNRTRNLMIIVGGLGMLVILGTAGFQSRIGATLSRAYSAVLTPAVDAGDQAGELLSREKSDPRVIERDRQITELKAEIANLQQKIDELHNARNTVQILPEKGFHAVSVKVLGLTGNRDEPRFRIRLPENAGARTGDAISGPDGYIGRIDNIQDRYATVELFNHEQNRLGAMTEDGSLLGIVSWSDDLKAVVFLPEKSVSLPGEGSEIVTSGLRGSTIVSRLPVATVSHSDRNRYGEEVAVLDLLQPLDGLTHAVLLQNLGHDGGE